MLTMHIAVNGKQIQVGDSLRGHIESTIAHISEKYFGNPLEASVTVSRERAMVKVDVSVHVGRGIQVQGQAENADAYAAFDAAADHIGKRLRRFKRRLRDHRRDGGGPAPVEEVAPHRIFAAAPLPALDDTDDDDNESDGGEWQPIVVAELETPIETLTVEAAVMHLELGQAPALMFRNSGTGGLNMVYRRQDGNIGWVDPAVTARA